MECFRQVFRCLKAPFTKKERVIEIGQPTNFRKEELPACFSDAESVISPNLNTPDRPILTKELQHVDVSGQPGSDDGEGRDNDRDDGPATVDGGQDSGSCAGDEHPPVKPRLWERMKLARWFATTQSEVHEDCHEMEAPSETVQVDHNSK